MINKNFKTGFVTLIGRPNVGKSTLLNHLLNQKIAITSDIAQTTRDRICGIVSDDNYQIVFIDTPGIHRPQDLLGKSLNTISYEALEDIEVVLFLTPADEYIGAIDKQIWSNITKAKKKYTVLWVITKIDLVSKDELILKIHKISKKFGSYNIIPISVKNNRNIDTLIKNIKLYLPVAQPFYPLDQITDKTQLFWIKEVVREKILHLTKEEVPHNIAILVDEIVDNKKIMKIYVSIIVDHASQKIIIIGKKGQLIKEIGTQARIDIEKQINKQVFLSLFVKIKKKWRNNANILEKIKTNN